MSDPSTARGAHRSERDPHRGMPVLTLGPSPSQARACVVLLHGRGASPEDVLWLGPELGFDDVAYVAPQAAGGSWYPNRFTAPVEANEPWLSSALATVSRVIEDCESQGVPRARIVLGGFSQGACLATEYAVRHPDCYGGLLVLSGGFIGPPGVARPPASGLAGTPAFIGCGSADAHIPSSRVEESAALLRASGADVTLRIYPGMGHAVNEDEIGHARKVVDEARDATRSATIVEGVQRHDA